MGKQKNEPWKERPNTGRFRDERVASRAAASSGATPSQSTGRSAGDGDAGTHTATGCERQGTRDDRARRRGDRGEENGRTQDTDAEVLRQLVDEKRRQESSLQRRYPAIQCRHRITADDLTFRDALMMGSMYAFVNGTQGVGDVHEAKNTNAVALVKDWPVLPIEAMLDEGRKGRKVWPCTFSARGILSGWMRLQRTAGIERRRLTVPGFLWKRDEKARPDSLPVGAYWWTTADGRTDLFGVDHLLCVGGAEMTPYACRGSHIEAVALAEEVSYRIGETEHFPPWWLQTLETGIEELMVGEVLARTRKKLEIEGHQDMEPTFGRARQFIQKAVWEASPAQVSVVMSLLITGIEALRGKKDIETGKILGAKDLFLEAVDEVERAVDERRISWPLPEVYSLSGEMQDSESLASRIVRGLCQEGSVLHLTVPEIVHCIRST